MNESQFLKDFSKNIWSVILEKKSHNFDLQGIYRSTFKFDFEQLKDIITATKEIFTNFWRHDHRSHFVSAKWQLFFNQYSPFTSLDLCFSDVLSGYRIATLPKIGVISYWTFWWVISFSLESFVRLSWIT